MVICMNSVKSDDMKGNMTAHIKFKVHPETRKGDYVMWSAAMQTLDADWPFAKDAMDENKFPQQCDVCGGLEWTQMSFSPMDIVMLARQFGVKFESISFRSEEGCIEREAKAKERKLIEEIKDRGLAKEPNKSKDEDLIAWYKNMKENQSRMQQYYGEFSPEDPWD